MIIRNIISELYRTGNNPRRLFTTGIVLHYDGVDYKTSGVGLTKNIAISSVKSKSYAVTLQYHYRITRAGEILYCVDDKDRLWHCGNYGTNLVTISVCLEGIGYTDKQRGATAQLVAYLRNKYGKSLRITGHRDHSATACPGNAAYADIPNLNNILGASTTMEVPYNKRDLIKTNTGRDTLGYRRDPRVSGELLPVQGLPKAGRLPNGTILEIIGHSEQADGYLWMDVSVLPSYPNEPSFQTGWVAVKSDSGANYTKLYKKAESVSVESAQAVLDQIKVKNQELVDLYNKLDNLVN